MFESCTSTWKYKNNIYEWNRILTEWYYLVQVSGKIMTVAVSKRVIRPYN